MSLPFPTGRKPRGSDNLDQRIGHPHRATACQCGPQAIHDGDGGCIRCGYYLRETIEQTWQERARTIRNRQRRIAVQQAAQEAA